MARLSPRFDITHRLIDMPDTPIPPGSVVHVEVVEVVETNSTDDSSIEITLRYLDHEE